ncbi:MAG TPA: tRNA (adenosine(37)-N6)-threonylcarbamoyltransferase complex ATPase subunit type 1 TsaE [Dehalococcoidia bacterium]|nr:tRNA (adenosine(37)-N6)-threonylcarbamoyltransferase complex ATPase subunit type 1 TsaE [Dehalococcoidia bacterium]
MDTDLTLVSTSPKETFEVGRRLAGLLAPGDTVLLIGELGAGKTALTQAIAAGLGATEEVSSPTFTLVNEYRGRWPIFHFDLYRLDDPAEAIDLGFDDYLNAGGVAIVEWADKAPGLWPDEYLAIEIERTGETARRLAVRAAGAGPAERLRAWRPDAAGGPE